MVSLSGAAYVAPYYVLLVLPLCPLASLHSASRTVRPWWHAFAVLCGCLLLLAMVSSVASGIPLSVWVCSSWGAIVTVPERSPDLGLFWYFFLEVFLHFERFFLFVFHAHVPACAVALFLRLRGSSSHEPHLLPMLWALLVSIAVLRAYPSLADISLHLAVLPLVWGEARPGGHALTPVYVALWLAVFAPLALRAWLVSGTGNANFYYGSGLAWAAAQALLVSDALTQMLKRDFLIKHRIQEYAYIAQPDTDRPKQE
jgi:GPI-anchor transamidase subunit U